MGVDSLYPQEDMFLLETMDDYTSDFRMIFKEVSEEQIRKDPRTIISYMRDIRIDPAIIRVIDTMIMYSRMDFIASITCPDDSVLKSVDRIASNTFVDKGVLTQLINMMRDARGLGTTVIRSVEFASPITSPHQKTNQKVTSATAPKPTRPVVKMVACKDPETGIDVMMAADGSAYYSKDQKELIRCDKNTTVLVILDSVEIITREAFKGCEKLQELYFPKAMTTIHSCFFEDCSQLKTIYIPETVTDLGELAICGCSSLAYLKLPSSLKIIGSDAIYNCPSLTEIIIPENVAIVRSFGLGCCDNLRTITVKNADTVFAPFSFDCKNVTDLYIRKGSKASKTVHYAIQSCQNCTVHEN